MGITFRHDAAAVALPTTNASGRKYGQQLVLQQQQQKYATQQAQQERMFDAYKMESQQQFQDKRDTKQVINQQLRDWQQRDFILNRDRDQNKLQQEQQRAADFAAARSRIDTHAKDMLNNGEIKDPAARNRLSALIAGKTIVMGSGFDETARKEYLDAYNAELAKILAEVPPPKPQPTEQERIDSLPVMDGVRYGKDKDGNPVPVMVQDEETGTWKPYERPSSSRSSGQKGAKGDSGASQRPVTFEEYYGADEDKFQEALNAELQTMQDNFVPDPEGKKKMPTREDALNKMRDDYDFRQKALGKAQYGEPTPAKPYGQALGEARQATEDKVKGGYESYSALADMNDKLLELENRANSLPKGSKEAAAAWSAYRKERDRIINGATPPAPEMKSIIDPTYGRPATPGVSTSAAPSTTPTAQTALPAPSQPTAPPPVATTPQPAPKNAWAQVATPPATPTPAAPGPAPTEQGLVDMGPAYTGQLDASGIPTEDPVVTNRTMNTPPRSKTPDFGSLASNATDNTDKVVISKLQGIYSTAKPEVQSAIGVLVNPGVTDSERASAARYLREAGIDIEKLLDTPKQTSKPVSPRDPNYYPKTSKPVSPRDPKNKNYYPKTSKPGS